MYGRAMRLAAVIFVMLLGHVVTADASAARRCGSIKNTTISEVVTVRYKCSKAFALLRTATSRSDTDAYMRKRGWTCEFKTDPTGTRYARYSCIKGNSKLKYKIPVAF